MRKFMRLYLILLIFGLSLYAQVKPLKKVSLQLNWKNQFEFAGFYMAKEKGYYRDAHLDVEIREFCNEVNVAKSVIEQNATFGVTYTNVLLNADKVVLLSAIYQSSPHVLVSLKSSNIRSVEDFKNKKIMIANEAAKSASIISMLHSRGILLSDMTLQKPTFDINSLIQKKTDISSVFLTNEIYRLDKSGIAYNIWNPKDYGFDFYSDLLFTSRAFLKQSPEVVESFTKASLKGWQYALTHIDETVDVILKKYNTQDKSEGALLYEARVSKKLILNHNTSLGEIDKEKIQRMLDIYRFLQVVHKSVDVDALIYKMPLAGLNKTEKQYLQKKRVIRMCVNPNWMPLEALKDGEYVGIVSDYFDIFEKKFHLPIEIVKTKSWSQTLKNIKTHKCDIVSLANKTNLRQKYLNFTDPYMKVAVVMATKRGNPYIGNLHKLSKKKVAIVKDYAFVDFVKLNYPNLEIVEVDNIDDGLKRVDKGEVYGYIGALPTIAYALGTKYIHALKIVGQINTDWSLGVGVRSDDVILYDIMQKVVRSIDEKSKSEIIRKWFSEVKYEKGRDYALIYMIVSVFLVLFLVGFFFYVKLVKLNEKIKKQNERLQESQRLLQKREQELEILASTDPMTHLYNRRAFSQISESLFTIAKRDNQKLSVVMLDIDNFKNINDTYGHKTGDSVIIMLSEQLQELSRESDIICRYGGEEFIMLLPNTDSKGGYFIAQKIRSEVEKLKIDTPHGQLKFTISMGISEIRVEKDESIEAVIKRADDALYESKRSGKNCVTIA